MPGPRSAMLTQSVRPNDEFATLTRQFCRRATLPVTLTHDSTTPVADPLTVTKSPSMFPALICEHPLTLKCGLPWVTLRKFLLSVRQLSTVIVSWAEFSSQMSQVVD